MRKMFIYPIVTLALIVLSGICMPATTHAALFDNSRTDACSGISGTSASGACTTKGVSVSDIISRVVNIISAIVGVIAVIMIMVAGAKYVTSGGEASSIASAKNTLVYSVVGLIIVLFAQIIVRFTITTSTVTTKPKKTSQVVRV